MKRLHHWLARQASDPSGIWGRLFGMLMTRANQGLIVHTLDALELKLKDQVLEVGFGPGIGLKLALQRARAGKITGIDRSQTMFESASRLLAQEIEAGRVRIELGEGIGQEGGTLPFEKEAFDAAFAVNVHYFWDDVESACREFMRVLRPGGRLAFGSVDPAAMAKHSVTQTGIYTLYTPVELMALLREAGFEAIEHLPGPQHPVGPTWCVRGRRPSAA